MSDIKGGPLRNPRTESRYWMPIPSSSIFKITKRFCAWNSCSQGSCYFCQLFSYHSWILDIFIFSSKRGLYICFLLLKNISFILVRQRFRLHPIINKKRSYNFVIAQKRRFRFPFYKDPNILKIEFVNFSSLKSCLLPNDRRWLRRKHEILFTSRRVCTDLHCALFWETISPKNRSATGIDDQNLFMSFLFQQFSAFALDNFS